MTTTPSFRYDRAPIGALQGALPRASRLLRVGKQDAVAGITNRLDRIAAQVDRRGEPAKLFDDMGTTVLEQLTLACFFDAGGSRNLRRMRAIYRRGRDATLQALATSLPAAVSSGVAAGLHVIRAATAMVRADPRRARPRPRVAHRRSQLASVRTTVSATGVGARLWCARRTSDPPRPSDPRLDLPSTTIVVGLTAPQPYDIYSSGGSITARDPAR
jgi:hypothetical protein